MSPLKQKGKKLSAKARKGLEWAITEVKMRLDAGYDVFERESLINVKG